MLQTDNPIQEPGCLIYRMSHHNNRSFMTVHMMAHQFVKALAAVIVHSRSRLIEHKYIRLLCQCPGETNALLLAAGQFPDPLIPKLPHAYLLQALLDNGMMLALEAAKQSKPWIDA